MTKRINRSYTTEFKQEAVALVTEQGYSVPNTSKHYRKLLAGYGMRASMGDVGACWDNAVVERFFGSLKHDWLLKVPQATREHMRNDVTAVFFKVVVA
jgi:putative transposase